MSSYTRSLFLGGPFDPQDHCARMDSNFSDEYLSTGWNNTSSSCSFDYRFDQARMFEQPDLIMSEAYSQSYPPALTPSSGTPSPSLDSDNLGSLTPGNQNAFSPTSTEDYNTQYLSSHQSIEHFDERGELLQNGFVNPSVVARDPYPLSPTLVPSYYEGSAGGAYRLVTEGSHMAHGETFSIPSRTRQAGPEYTGDNISEAGDMSSLLPQGDSMDRDSTAPRRGVRSSSRNSDATRKRTRQAPKASVNHSKKARTTAGSSRSYQCSTCSESFASNHDLEGHTLQAHARPLICVFGYAGCTSTFTSKNEWKRHVLSQHIILNYWLCTDPVCVRTNPESGGTIFNRKDLYTQHVRRMHVPDKYKDSVNKKSHTPEWDRILRHMQDGAERKRCSMPNHMRCPAEGCSTEFRGVNAWDDRMEHVARHLDKPGEPRVIFGGDHDCTLTDWASNSRVNIVRRVGVDGWELVVPLKTTAKELVAARKGIANHHHINDSEEDADGEPE